MRYDYATAPEEYGGEERNERWGDAFLDITTRQGSQKHWVEVSNVLELWERDDDKAVDDGQDGSSRRGGGVASP